MSVWPRGLLIVPTSHSKYRFGPETLGALDRIAARIAACRGERVTTADVIRWLAALHDPDSSPGREYTRDELLGFPRVYPEALRRAAGVMVESGPEDAPTVAGTAVSGDVVPDGPRQ